MAHSTPAHKQPINEPLDVQPPRPVLGLFHRSMGLTEIKTGPKTLAAIEHPGGLSLDKPRLLIAGRRFRFDRPEDASIQEGLGNFLSGLVGMPRRRAIWRAGSGIATEISETSPTRKRLSGHFEIDARPYHVHCNLQEGFLKSEFDRRLYGPDGPLAVLETNAFDRHSYTLTPYRPIPLDALTIGIHLMFWLEKSAGGNGAGGGAGGGGGGGGDGGGGG